MTPRRRLLLAGVMFASAALACVAASAAETGDAAAGRALTDRSCAVCHSPTARGGDAAPSLPRLMRGRSTDEARLRSWLATPHPPLRGTDLSPQQTEDVIAWLRQLARE